MGYRLDDAYQHAYLDQLRAVAGAEGIQPRELALFWPAVGARYDGELLVIGRAVNGSSDRWSLDLETDLASLTRQVRETAEDDVRGDPLGWVIDRWMPGDGGYDTSKSQFWETIRRVFGAIDPSPLADWPSHVVWTNLAKLAPWAGGNPNGRLRAILADHGSQLLRQEIEAFAPRRVVAFTGRWWFEPFASALGLDVDWRDGYVEGVADDGQRRWVVAVHPMTRSPRAVADAVTEAWS